MVMLDDLGSALRRLRRKPGVAVVAALSLALGAGATAGIFGYLEGFYFRPLAVPRGGGIVRLFASTEREAFDAVSYPEYREIRARSTTLASLGVAQRRGTYWFRPGERVQLGVSVVSPEFFRMLELRPALGRFFGPDDTAPVAVLGHSAWVRHFGADPAIVGRSIRILRGPVTVLGVLPPEFRDLEATGDQDLWVPVSTFAVRGGDWSEFEDPRNNSFMAVGRLKSGADLRRLNGELGAMATAERRLGAMSDFDWRMQRAGTTGWALLGLVILLVIISCVNVANLLLSQVEGRRREIATRAALGASRGRLARQLFCECLLVGAAGTAGGLLLGHWLIEALPALMGLPVEYRSLIHLELDPRVLACTVAVSLATAVLFGLAPAFTGSRADLSGVLRGAPAVRNPRFPLRAWLAVSQLALALVLLSATTMLGRSFWNARYGEIGIARKQVLNAYGHPERGPAERQVMARIRALPGVRDVAIAIRAPLSPSGDGRAMPVALPGHAPATVKFNSVDARYFNVLGIRLLKGRVFTDADTETAPPVAVIAEAMARRYWPAADPIGRFIGKYQVVGVVADAPIGAISELPEPYLYTCWWQNSFGERTLLIEAAGDAAALGPAVRTVLDRPELATMDELIRYRTTARRTVVQLVALLMALGLALAAVGFFGVVSHGVTQRTHEIGIRMAVGARARDAAWLVVRGALLAAAGGISLGLPCSLAVAFGIHRMLFGVSPWYAPAFLGAAAVLLIVALAAAMVPAMRAARVDPLGTLRCE